MDNRIIIHMSVLIAAVMLVPSVNAALTQRNSQQQTAPAVASSSSISTIVKQMTSSNYTTNLVHPPAIVLQSFESITSSPGYHKLGPENYMISSPTGFVIFTQNYTVSGTHLPRQNAKIYFQSGNNTEVFILGANDGTEYNVTNPGVGNFSIIPKSNDIADSATVVAMFAMIAPSSMNVFQIGDAPTPCSDCGSTGYTTWTHEMGASASNLAYVDGTNTAYNEGGSYASFTVNLEIEYTTSSLVAGFISASASYWTSLPNSPAGAVPFDAGYVTVQGPLGSGISYTLSLTGSGSNYGSTTSYTFQNVKITATYYVLWYTGNTYIKYYSVDSVSVPQLT